MTCHGDFSHLGRNRVLSRRIDDVLRLGASGRPAVPVRGIDGPLMVFPTIVLVGLFHDGRCNRQSNGSPKSDVGRGARTPGSVILSKCAGSYPFASILFLRLRPIPRAVTPSGRPLSQVCGTQGPKRAGAIVIGHCSNPVAASVPSSRLDRTTARCQHLKNLRRVQCDCPNSVSAYSAQYSSVC
jgi:hypothetical protein